MSDTDALQGERHAETPTSARRISRRHTVIGIGAVAVLVAGFFAFRHGGSSEEGSSVEQTPRISSMVAFEPAKTDAVNGPPPTLANPGVGAPVLNPSQAAGANGQVPALQPGGAQADEHVF